METKCIDNNINNSSGIYIFYGADIEKALFSGINLYLTGYLERPQPQLAHIDHLVFDGVDVINVECGLSYFEKPTPNKCHMHPYNCEYVYVLEGQVDVVSLITKDIYCCGEGSLFIVEPNTPYASKNADSTKVLFFKVPGGNDKVLVEADDEVISWLNTPIQ